MSGINGSIYSYMRDYRAKNKRTVAFVRGRKKTAYGRFFRRVDRVAGGLAALGVKKGDVVMIATPTIQQGVTAFYAVSRLGAIASMIHPLMERGEFDEAVMVSRGKGPLSAVNVKTLPYPGFPTDMNPQMTVLLCLADGTSQMSETIWNNRFRYVDELQRMGAKIKVDDKTAVIEGNTVFTPACVKACDLRAGAAMVVAALAANGVSEIDETIHIERGYENIVEKLQLLGADIRRVEIPANAITRAI